MGSFRALRLLPALLLCGLLLGTPGGAAAGTPATVADTQPGWATPLHRAGAEPASNRLVFSVWLGWRSSGDLQSRLHALYTPGSPTYHRWLTPSQFRILYSPSESSVNTVRQWLAGQGFSIIEVPQNRLFVSASGTVAQVERAFAVNENLYRVDGKLVGAPDRDPTIPQPLAPAVSAITGLDGALSLARPEHHSAPPPPPSGRSVGPCSKWWDERQSTAFRNPFHPGAPLPWIICGYQPAQIDSAYGIDQLRRRGLDGSGQTIAITGAFFSPTIVGDANHFSGEFGLPKLNGGNFRQIVAPGTLKYPKDPSQTQDWYIEQALDVEWAHAVAPRAKIVYVGAANDARGLDQAVNYVVDNHLANIVSNSWDLLESLASKGEMRAMNSVFEQAAAQGMGVYFASGDDGDNAAATGKMSVGFPDSSPWVTSVGGTSLAIGSSGQYLWESGWGTTTTDWNGNAWSPAAPGDFYYGSGGGVSHFFAQPWYQTGVVPAGLAAYNGSAHRAEPDLAMAADPQTGVVFSQTYVDPNGHRRIIDSWIGGTSLSTPLTAGLMALADQSSGRPHGFLNPLVYRLAGSAALHDVTSTHGTLAVLRNALLANGQIVTRLRSLDRDSSLHTLPGWDPVTGLGSPVGPAFLAILQ